MRESPTQLERPEGRRREGEGRREGGCFRRGYCSSLTHSNPCSCSRAPVCLTLLPSPPWIVPWCSVVPDWLRSPGVGFHFRVWGHSVPLCVPLKKQALGFRAGEKTKTVEMGQWSFFFFFYGGVGSHPRSEGLQPPMFTSEGWNLFKKRKRKKDRGWRGRQQTEAELF